MANDLISPAGGLLLEWTVGVAETLGLMAAVGGMCVRTWAVLTRKPDDRLNWWMAMGAAAGVIVMLLVVLVDLAIEGG